MPSHRKPGPINANSLNSRTGLSGLASLSGLSQRVYSTDTGRLCRTCQAPVAECRCKALQAEAAAAAAARLSDGVVRVSRSRAGRGGKTVSLVQGAPQDAAGLADLAKALKAACGTGGTVKDGVIELQGDHVAALMQQLAARGWKVKQAGG